MTTGVALTGGVFCFAIISDETAEDIARRRDESATDRKVETALKDDAAAGMKLLADLITKSKLAAAEAKAEFERAMAEATADGDVTDEEKERIDNGNGPGPWEDRPRVQATRGSGSSSSRPRSRGRPEESVPGWKGSCP